METKYQIGISDDYATITTPNGLEFYYGYEETINNDWAFVAKNLKGKIIKYSKSFLEKHCDNLKGRDDEPFYYLLAGIGLTIDKELL